MEGMEEGQPAFISERGSPPQPVHPSNQIRTITSFSPQKPRRSVILMTIISVLIFWFLISAIPEQKKKKSHVEWPFGPPRVSAVEFLIHGHGTEYDWILCPLAYFPPLPTVPCFVSLEAVICGGHAIVFFFLLLPLNLTKES